MKLAENPGHMHIEMIVRACMDQKTYCISLLETKFKKWPKTDQYFGPEGVDIKDHIDDQNIYLSYVPKKEMIADVLTKAVSLQAFKI